MSDFLLDISYNFLQQKLVILGYVWEVLGRCSGGVWEVVGEVWCVCVFFICSGEFRVISRRLFRRKSVLHVYFNKSYVFIKRLSNQLKFVLSSFRGVVVNRFGVHLVDISRIFHRKRARKALGHVQDCARPPPHRKKTIYTYEPISKRKEQKTD